MTHVPTQFISLALAALVMLAEVCGHGAIVGQAWASCAVQAAVVASPTAEDHELGREIGASRGSHSLEASRPDDLRRAAQRWNFHAVRPSVRLCRTIDRTPRFGGETPFSHCLLGSGLLQQLVSLQI
ncbi:MAG: hypothetical protein JSS27_03765 [Planctomycetes bacterium]|nr:hypothetical protein [Planctomycetota bacterium]